MIKEIVRDIFFLSQVSSLATKQDLYIGQDLRDTLKANKDRCVGMAANMIGYQKNIIIVSMGLFDVVMYNPKIISKSNEYKTEEGCLSLDGVRPCVRHKNIKVEYRNDKWDLITCEYSGFIAQIIEHECDHLSGKII